jgi:hypothetical protein
VRRQKHLTIGAFTELFVEAVVADGLPDHGSQSLAQTHRQNTHRAPPTRYSHYRRRYTSARCATFTTMTTNSRSLIS